MVPRLVRRVEMDIQFPVAQIKLCQMVFFRKSVKTQGSIFKSPKRSSRRWYPVRLDRLKWTTTVRGDGTPFD